MRDLGNQSVNVEPMDHAGDLGALLSNGIRFLGCLKELSSQVAISEPEDMLAPEGGLEEAGIFFGDGIEPANRAMVEDFGLREAMEIAEGPRGIFDLRERREVALVGRE